jgi:hypothetical protein
MSDYRVIVSDRVHPALAGHDGVAYRSLPQPHEYALELVPTLIGLTQLPDELGPWREARPGGIRTVRIEPVP